MDNFSYPDRYALEQALGEFWQSQHVEMLAQEMGVIITNSSQHDLAKFLSGIFFEYSQLDRIRGTALQLNGSSTLSGFRVQTEDTSFDLTDFIETYRGKTVAAPDSLTVKPLIQDNLQGTEAEFTGAIEYTQNKPGRVEFLQGTQRSFSYNIRKVDDNEWEILVDCSRSNDGRIMEDWIKKIIPKKSFINKLEQDMLTTAQTIQFFDNLGLEGATQGWRFTQVKRLVLRSDDSSNTEDDDGNAEKVETDINVLSGITQAILEGSELRDNLFVRQCESGGYRFSAMTYEYESIQHPFIKEVRAEFKNRPKIFEVSLVQYRKRTGTDQTLQTHILSDKDRVLLLSEFWAIAKRVYSKITASNSHI